MTVSKNPENITAWTSVKQFPPLCNLHLHLCIWLENPSIFTKMWTFSLRFSLVASAESLKNVKSLKTKNFKKSKTKTSKAKTSKTKTTKYFSKVKKIRNFKKSKTRTPKNKTSKTKVLEYFSMESFIFVFFLTVHFTCQCRMTKEC